MKRFKVSIISPFPVFIKRLKEIVKKEKSLYLGRTADNYNESMQLVKESYPDIIIAGISPRSWGNIVEDIRNNDSDLPVLVYSACNEYGFVKVCFELGANGYFLMEETEEEIVKAVHTILEGKKYFSDGVKDYKTVISALDKYIVPIHRLTPQEARIFNLIGERHSNKEITDILHIKDGTLKSHLEHIGIKSKVSIDKVCKYAFQYAYEKARMPTLGE